MSAESPLPSYDAPPPPPPPPPPTLPKPRREEASSNNVEQSNANNSSNSPFNDNSWDQVQVAAPVEVQAPVGNQEDEPKYARVDVRGKRNSRHTETGSRNGTPAHLRQRRE